MCVRMGCNVLLMGRITAEVSRHVTAASSGKAQSDRSRVERPTRADAAVDSTACRPPTLINITVPHMQAFIETRNLLLFQKFYHAVLQHFQLCNQSPLSPKYPGLP